MGVNPKSSTIITQAKENKAQEIIDKKGEVSAAVDIKNDINKQKVEKVKQLVQQQPNKPETRGQKQAEQIVNSPKQTKINDITENKKVEVSNVKDISKAEHVDLILAPAKSVFTDDKQKENKDESRISSPTQNMPATSLDRLPSPLKIMFAKTENISPKHSPENEPKWYNNVPKEDTINASKIMSEMKNDINKQKKKTDPRGEHGCDKDVRRGHVPRRPRRKDPKELAVQDQKSTERRLCRKGKAA